jgi:HlyD family secretion protein
MKPRLSRRWIVGAGVVLLAVWLVSAFTGRRGGTEVEVATVGRGMVEDAVTNSQAGTVMSRQRSRLGAAGAGRVVAILRREGATVRRGDVLVRLDDDIARGQLAVARRDSAAAGAAVESARAAAALAKTEFERATRLFADRLLSDEAMDQARSRRESADATLDGARAQLGRASAAVGLAAKAVEDMQVTAPFPGVVTRRFVEVGEAVAPGQPVLEVLNPDSLYVSAPIDEMDIGRLRVGQQARVTLDPYPGVVWPGTVVRMAPFVNDVQLQNRTLEVEIALPPAPGRPVPKPGASADVEIVIQKKDGVLRVPTAALLEGRRVLAVDGGRARAREVTTGLRNWDWTEVVAGLSGGERVITTLDRPGLKDGTAVSPKPARERAGAGAAAAGGDSAAGGP